MKITYIGGPTALIEIGPWRLLADPTFDPPGERCFFGWGTVSRKLAGPAIPFADLELGSRSARRVHDHTWFCPECREMIETLRRTLDGLAGLRRRDDDRVAADVIARLRDDL